MEKRNNSDLEWWEDLLRQEDGLFYVCSDLELLTTPTGRFGFSKENAEKIFDKAITGFQAMTEDPSVAENERKAALMSIHHLKIVPLRYH
jgi:hypothetical protein